MFKKADKRKVLRNVEKAGQLSKVEELGVTLSSLETRGLLSKAEDLRVPSLDERAICFLLPPPLPYPAAPLIFSASCAAVSTTAHYSTTSVATSIVLLSYSWDSESWDRPCVPVGHGTLFFLYHWVGPRAPKQSREGNWNQVGQSGLAHCLP